jgi:hypothetical protein
MLQHACTEKAHESLHVSNVNHGQQFRVDTRINVRVDQTEAFFKSRDGVYFLKSLFEPVFQNSLKLVTRQEKHAFLVGSKK